MPRPAESDSDEAMATDRQMYDRDKVKSTAFEEEMDAITCTDHTMKCLVSTEKCLNRMPMCQIRPLPCLKRPGQMNRTFEANSCCFCMGRRGFFAFAKLRKFFLLISSILSLAGIVLRAMPAAALNSDEGWMGYFPWAGGDYICLDPEICRGYEAKVYIGLDSLLVEVPGEIRNTIRWSADDCVQNLESLGAAEYCDICNEASTGCAAMAFLSIFAGLVNLFTDIQRMSAKNDHNCIKVLAILSNLVGALMLFSATMYFQYYCVSAFPREDDLGHFQLDLEIGNGGLLVACAAGINLLNIVSHWLVQVPEHRWRTHGEFSFSDPCPGEWPPVNSSVTDVESFDGTLPDGSGGMVVTGSGPGWKDDQLFEKRQSQITKQAQVGDADLKKSNDSGNGADDTDTVQLRPTQITTQPENARGNGGERGSVVFARETAWMSMDL